MDPDCLPRRPCVSSDSLKEQPRDGLVHLHLATVKRGKLLDLSRSRSTFHIRQRDPARIERHTHASVTTNSAVSFITLRNFPFPRTGPDPQAGRLLACLTPPGFPAEQIYRANYSCHSHLSADLGKQSETRGFCWWSARRACLQ